MIEKWIGKRVKLMEMTPTRNSWRKSWRELSIWASGKHCVCGKGRNRADPRDTSNNHLGNLMTGTARFSRKNGDSGSGWTWVQIAAPPNFQHYDLGEAFNSSFVSFLCCRDRNNNTDLAEVWWRAVRLCIQSTWHRASLQKKAIYGTFPIGNKKAGWLKASTLETDPWPKASSAPWGLSDFG